MADETGLSQPEIRTRCSVLGITPVKLRDQAKQFVRNHCHSKTPSQISKLGGYRMEYLADIYKELGIPFRRILDKINWNEDGNAMPPVLLAGQGRS